MSDDYIAEHEVPPDFRDAVAELLYHSQMIEWLVRVYLSDINEAADVLLRGEGVRFKQRTKDLEKRSFGQLVNLFEAHNDDAELVRRLRSFVQHRNAAAHTAFVWGFVNREKPDQVAAVLEKVRAHCAEGRELVEAMTRETVKSYDIRTDPRLHVALPRPGRAPG